MKFIRTNRALGLLIALMTLLGWLALSNHCALGLMAKTVVAQKAHSCCHNGNSEPVKEPGDGKRNVECCKSLHAVLPDGAKLPAAHAPVFAVLPVVWVLALQAQMPERTASAGDTGPPPDVPTFAELVLQRSLLSHAPPVSA